MNFKRKALRVARHQRRHEEISQADYRKVLELADDAGIMTEWETKVKQQVGAPWEVQTKDEIDWSAIQAWFIENWPATMEILFALPISAESSAKSEESNVDDSGWPFLN